MTVVLHVTVVVLLVETGVGDDGGNGSAGNGGNGNGNGDVCKHIFGEGVTITYYQQEPLSRQPTTTRGGWVEVKSIAVRACLCVLCRAVVCCVVYVFWAGQICMKGQRERGADTSLRVSFQM